jgi:ligand-binding sensor domain-containing protein
MKKNGSDRGPGAIGRIGLPFVPQKIHTRVRYPFGISLLGLLLYPCLLWAQPQPFARVYAGEQGLPSNIVTEVLQDRNGYLWLASGNGLCRYDGYGFTNLHAGAGLSDANVLFLEEDRNGRIWFLTLDRNVYYVQGDSIRPFPGNARIGDITKNKGTPHGFHVSPQGDSLFLAVGQSGVLCMDAAGNARLEAPGKSSSKIVYEKNGQWLVTQTSGGKAEGQLANKVGRFDFHRPGKAFTIEFPPPDKGEPQSMAGMSWGEDAGLVASGTKLFFVKNQSWQWFAEMSDRILHIGKEEAGAIFIGLQNGNGLRRYAGLDALREGRFTLLAPGRSVRWWYADRQGGCWVATQEQGVLYYPNSAVNTYTEFPGMEQNRPYALAVQDGQHVFLGFGQGKVLCLNPASGETSPLPVVPLSNTILDLAYDPATGRLWAATNYAQYWHNGQWSAPLFPNDRGIPASRIGFAADGARLLFGSQKGLVALDAQSLDWSASDNTSVFIAATDAKGAVWAGTPAGLFRWDGETFVPPGFRHPAFQNAVEQLLFLPDSAFIFSAGRDIFRWKNEEVRCLSCEAGISVPPLSDLLADRRGFLWLAAGKQLIRLDPTPGKLCRARIFSAMHGLPPGNIKALDFHSDTIWVLTDAGPAALPLGLPEAAPASVVLEALWVNNTAQPAQPGRHFAFGENNLSFQFATLNFRSADQTRYRYRLHTADDWQETTERLLHFFSIGEGRYRLEVQAQNEDGVWGESLAFPFVVKPPFYRAWWFLGGLGLLLAAVGFGAFRYRLREVQKEAGMREQIAALERSALQAQMNPHFIFNSLNSIQNFIMQNEKQQAAQYLATFARLVRDSLNASAAGKVTLEDEVRMLENYLALEKMRFKNRFDFAVEVADDTDAFDILLPPLLIQPFVENAVLHGMKNAAGQGFIRVFFEEKEDVLAVTVEDNGPGLSAGKEAAEARAHKSLGMGITQKRLALLGGKAQAESLHIEELKNEKGEVQGTRVRVEIGV